MFLFFKLNNFLISILLSLGLKQLEHLQLSLMIFALVIFQVLDTFPHSQDNGLKLCHFIHDSSRVLVIDLIKLSSTWGGSSLTSCWNHFKSFLICYLSLTTSFFNYHIWIIHRFLFTFSLGCWCSCSQTQTLISLQSLELDVRLKIFPVFTMPFRLAKIFLRFFGCVCDLSNFFTKIKIILQINFFSILFLLI